MSLSQCVMSSIVTVSFLCKQRNNEAFFPLAFFKWMLAGGLGAALAVVELGIFFGAVACFYGGCCVLNPRLTPSSWKVDQAMGLFAPWRLSLRKLGKILLSTSTSCLRCPWVAFWNSLLFAGQALGWSLRDTCLQASSASVHWARLS